MLSKFFAPGKAIYTMVLSVILLERKQGNLEIRCVNILVLRFVLVLRTRKGICNKFPVFKSLKN